MIAVVHTSAKRAGRAWSVAGCAGLAAFFLLEARLRRRGAASSLKASADDRGSTRGIVAAYTVASASALLFRGARQLPAVVGAVGVATQAAGIALRAWSMRTLGASYTRTLRVRRRQPVVTSGPYRVVRHPGYAGSLLVWIGFGLATRRLPVIETATAAVGLAYGRRIVAEERMLNRRLRGYADYSAHTRRLIPGVW